MYQIWSFKCTSKFIICKTHVQETTLSTLIHLLFTSVMNKFNDAEFVSLSAKMLVIKGLREGEVNAETILQPES